MKEAGYPAMHHSAVYCLHYRPAYRVVATRYLPATLRWRLGDPAPR